MKIIVEDSDLARIAETIKQLPVNGNFGAADMWVGCVVALQTICSQSEPYPEDNSEGKGE